MGTIIAIEQVWQFLQAQEPELVSESPHLRRLRQSQDSRRQREKITKILLLGAALCRGNCYLWFRYCPFFDYYSFKLIR